MVECKEPGCVSKATRDWKGRAVCQDCYDKYRDKWDRIYMSMDE